MANEIGITFGHYVDYWILIPIDFLFGFLVTFAEPQVRVLCQQIEKASSGYVRASLMLYTLCIGVGVFAALAMARTIFAIPLLYILVPGYIIAFILLLFSDKTLLLSLSIRKYSNRANRCLVDIYSYRSSCGNEGSNPWLTDLELLV